MSRGGSAKRKNKKEKKSLTARNWAELPTELVGQILKRLSILSIYSIKLVCKPWCSAVQEEEELSLLRPAPSPPWLTLRAASGSGYAKKNKVSACFVSPSNRKVYCIEKKKRWPPPTEDAICVGSCQGWLAFFDGWCNIYLSNPFKHDDESSIRVLPPLVTLPGLSAVKEWDSSITVTKLVLSSAPSGEYTVMAICCDDDVYRHLENLIVFCKSGDTSWTALDGTLNYEDLYYSSNNQRFYASAVDGSFKIWDLRDSSSPKSTCIRFLPSLWSILKLSSDKLRSQSYPRMYLLELDGVVLLVVRYGQIINTFNLKTLYFDVYKLDRDSDEKPIWIQIKCLGDNVLFLGINNAMTFSARDFPELKGNSIYFTDDDNTYYYEDYGFIESFDMGIFNLEDNSFHPFYYPVDYEKISNSPVWISPNPW